MRIADSGVLQNATARSFGRRLAGTQFKTPRRRGKWLIVPTSGPTLLIHSGMTGYPHFVAPNSAPDRLDRLAIETPAGSCAIRINASFVVSGSSMTTTRSARLPVRRGRTPARSRIANSALR